MFCFCFVFSFLVVVVIVIKNFLLDKFDFLSSDSVITCISQLIIKNIHVEPCNLTELFEV